LGVIVVVPVEETATADETGVGGRLVAAGPEPVTRLVSVEVTIMSVGAFETVNGTPLRKGKMTLLDGKNSW
jgi:hypothetical protein